MSAARNYMRMEFPNLPENVAFARTTVAVFASQLDFTLDELDEIKVATSEAVSNTVITPTGRIRARWSCAVRSSRTGWKLKLPMRASASKMWTRP